MVMKLPICNQCTKELSWKILLFSFWLGYKPVKCERCNEVYNMTNTSKWKASFFITVPWWTVIYLLNKYLFNFYLALIILILFPLIMSLFVPFISKYRN
ncbi:TIGR04104 family putative zinc finger protein [Anaerobacillus sp. MEB173]|uniref:TIGR04104 family putative zinc finger protein n=1 Tax=Anaerobacillus sp. MEB173 TaxID=3383345 RepID=UPI003F926AFD